MAGESYELYQNGTAAAIAQHHEATYAHQDGSYELMTVGAADTLTGRGDGVTAQYIRRTAGGEEDIADGVATIKSIKGNTLVWNQLIGNSTPVWSANIGVTATASGGTYTLSGTSTAGGNYYFDRSVSVVAGHKYLMGKFDKHDVTPGENNGNVFLSFYDRTNAEVIGRLNTTDKAIVTAAHTSSVVDFYINISKDDVGVDCIVTPQLFDLTAMFGAGNEPNTVAEFEALFPEPYYPYDAGSLLSVQMEGIESADADGNVLTSRTIPAATYFPTGLKRVGDKYDALYADHADVVIGSVDMGTLDWTYNTSYDYPFFYPTNSMPEDFMTAPSGGITDYVACARYMVTQSATSGGFRGSDYDGCLCPITNAGYKFAIQDSAYTDEAAFKQAMSGVMLHYPLATPTTTPIDPPLNLAYRVESGGTEEVMVPTGELSAPPTLVTSYGYTAESLRDAVLSTIAPVENHKASTNYAIGSYLVHGGQLCKVTVAIATGESITIGTNVTATTVMAELLALTE